ncbi:MAG: hypothetical protein IID34_02165 [Planctomycetes bacterium]|nr:hypothetical protein [Planctomycetota bacterium]MCH8963978.1 hypothetical protein [Planctomycetota bacterium]MCH8967583.1 hypothetical protein [Planctomycetota bacterium]
MRQRKCLKKIMTWMTLIGMGGVSFQLSGCDQSIRSTVLGGLNGATDILLLSLTSALFQSLDNSGQDDDLTDGLTGGGV